jgi:hypothetical protein
MALATEQAATLQASSAENKALAFDNEQIAAADEAEAAELQEEAAVLFEKSEADAALAASEQVEVDELEAEIVVEEEEDAVHVAAAAFDEVTFESEMAEGAADAAEAARMEAQAHVEEIGVGICEIVPFLDIVCDFVGSVTAVGMEVGAATEATKASAEFATAAAAKADEEREIALAAEIQAKAVEDGALAVELEGEEIEEEELAEGERLEGEEKEAASEAKYEQAEVEEEAAAEENALAAEEEGEAGALTGEVIFHGVLSCWDAIMASIFGMLSLTYFTFRMTSTFVVPAVSKSVSTLTGFTACQGTGEVFLSEVWRDFGYFLNHCMLFLLVAGIFSNLLPGLEGNSLKARGGIILLFGFTGSCIQTGLVHVLPSCLAGLRGSCQLVLSTIQRVVVLMVLFVIELLIVWVLFGPEVFSEPRLEDFVNWWLWAIFLLPLSLHLHFLEIPRLRNHDVISHIDKAAVGENDAIPRCANEFEDAKIPSESDSLLPVHSCSRRKEGKPLRESLPGKSWRPRLQEDIKSLQLPLEALILSCMLGLVLHCLSSTHNLWPASKALLLSTRPEWLIPFGVVITVAGVSYIALSVWYG